MKTDGLCCPRVCSVKQITEEHVLDPEMVVRVQAGLILKAECPKYAQRGFWTNCISVELHHKELCLFWRQPREHMA